MEKTYPAYFGTYDRFGEIREHVDRYANLFLIGRNACIAIITRITPC